MTSHRIASALRNLVINYDTYNYIRIIDKKLNKSPEIIERINFKNIYIYYLNKQNYDAIIFYNKSNKVYRVLVRFDKGTSDFFMLNDFLDLKMRDYFQLDNMELLDKNDYYKISNSDIMYFEFIKKIDA
jgi:hypothetical protein